MASLSPPSLCPAMLAFLQLLLKVKVAQLCLTLCDPMDYTVLETVAFPFSKGSSRPRNQTQVSHIAGGFFTTSATREAQEYWIR